MNQFKSESNDVLFFPNNETKKICIQQWVNEIPEPLKEKENNEKRIKIISNIVINENIHTTSNIGMSDELNIDVNPQFLTANEEQSLTETIISSSIPDDSVIDPDYTPSSDGEKVCIFYKIIIYIKILYCEIR